MCHTKATINAPHKLLFWNAGSVKQSREIIVTEEAVYRFCYGIKYTIGMLFTCLVIPFLISLLMSCQGLYCFVQVHVFIQNKAHLLILVIFNLLVRLVLIFFVNYFNELQFSLVPTVSLQLNTYKMHHFLK